MIEIADIISNNNLVEVLVFTSEKVQRRGWPKKIMVFVGK